MNSGSSLFGSEQGSLDLTSDADGDGDFIVSEANRGVWERLESWQSWPSPWLAVVGPGRSGLSRLAERTVSQNGFRFLTASQLSGLGSAELDAMSKDGIVLDDADLVSNGHALMAALNRTDEYGRPAILFSHSLPSSLDIDPPDLRSRLKSMSVVEIAPPDDELFRSLLVRALKQKFVFLPDPVADHLLSRLPRSYAVIDDIVERLVRAMSREGRGLSLNLAKSVLADGPGTQDLFQSQKGI